MTSDAEIRRIAALPTKHGTGAQQQLFSAGYETWCEDGETQPAALVQILEDIGLCAISGDADHPESLVDIVDQPASLAVACSLVGVGLCSIEQFCESRRTSIQPWVVLREQYAETMLEMITAREDRTLKREIAELLLGKPPADHVQSYGGPTVTGVVVDPDGGEGQYLEVPLTAASTECLVGLAPDPASEAEDTPDKQGTRTLLRDNRLLVPEPVLTRRYRQYLSQRAFEALQDSQEELLSDEQRAWILENATAIIDAVDRLAAQGHRERLWTYVHKGDSLVTALQRAIEAYETESAPECGDPTTVEALYQVLQTYSPDDAWVRATIQRVTSVHHLRRRLEQIAEHPQLKQHEDTQRQLYTVKSAGGRGDSLTIEHPEDFLKLPCYQNLDQRLQEKGPTRKELWDLVRKTAWLPEYRSNGSPDVERILADIKDLFSRWPWYDSTITEQQVRYELRSNAADRRLDGTEPLPMGCDNPDMQQYCIGKAECSYSIYGSIPFAEALYDTLDETGADEP